MKLSNHMYRDALLATLVALGVGCGSNEDNKVVPAAPAVTGEQVNPDAVPKTDNPSVNTPTNTAEANQAKPGEVPAVSGSPAEATTTPKPQ